MDPSELTTTVMLWGERLIVEKVRAIVVAEHWLRIPQQSSWPELVSACRRHFETAMNPQPVVEASYNSELGYLSENGQPQEEIVLGSRWKPFRSERIRQPTAFHRTQQPPISFDCR